MTALPAPVRRSCDDQSHFDPEAIVAMTAVAVTFAAVIAPLFGVLMTWAGLRNGDRPEDLRTTVRLRPTAAGMLVRAELTNPSGRPVMVTVRVAPSPRAASIVGARFRRGTRVLPSAQYRRDETLLTCVPAFGAIQLDALVPGEARAGIRVHVTAYERRGRVRMSSQHLALPHGDRAPTEARRSRPVVSPQVRIDPRGGGPR
jgi:hypothetical protein